jgi:hypothetical protein
MRSRAGIGPTGHGRMGLRVALDFHAPHVSAADAMAPMVRAEQLCPYSNATRGDPQVTLSVDGGRVEQEGSPSSRRSSARRRRASCHERGSTQIGLA